MRRSCLSPHLFVLLALTTLLAAPLTAPGYFMFAHDARHTVYFMQMFDAALRDGALLPRWATDMVFGYGYPVWLILAPLPYYGAEFFHLLGLDFPAAIKAIEAVGWFASGLAMYLFGSRVLNKNAGLVAAVAYLFVPYHVVDLYVRGAMAEFLAFIFPPLILWGIYQIYTTHQLKYIPLTAISYAAMLLTHVQMTVLFSPVIAGYIAVLWLSTRVSRIANSESPIAHRQSSATNTQSQITNQKSTISNLQSLVSSPLPRSSLSILWGVAIAAFFFLPVLLEQRYLTSDPLIGGFFNFRLHFLNPSQLLSPFWGYGYAGINGNDQFSLQLGILQVFFSLIALLTLKRRDPVSLQIIYFALVTVAAVFAMLSISTPLWELAAPIVAFTQFPWRVLFVSSFALSFLTGAALRIIPQRAPGAERSDQFRVALLVSLLLALAMFPVARPQYTETPFTWNTMMDFQVNDRELLGDTVWVQTRPEDSPLVEQYRAGNITSKAIVLEGDAFIDLLERRPLGDTVRVDAKTPTRIQFYTRYFPGWTATVDGINVPVGPAGEQGLLTLDVPVGTHTVTTRWGTTTPRVVGGALSIIAFLAAAFILWRFRNS